MRVAADALKPVDNISLVDLGAIHSTRCSARRKECSCFEKVIALFMTPRLLSATINK